jgi:hypothetical protein
MSQIASSESQPVPWYERLSREGRLRLGSQRLDLLRFTAVDRNVDVEGALQAVREEQPDPR